VRQKIVLGGDVWQDKREWKKKREKYWRESSGDGYVRDREWQRVQEWEKGLRGLGLWIKRKKVKGKENEKSRSMLSATAGIDYPDNPKR